MAAPQNLAPGVYRVDALRFSNFINVLLLENDDGWTLVDTGVASSVGRIEAALASLGSGPRDLSTTTTRAVLRVSWSGRRTLR
jgi:glyoxylase-like metal-dependent hydrolase (beta-lactamase superfamily II)